MSRIRHRHRKRSTAGEKPEVGRKHGGAASVHMRGEGTKAALRPDRKSRRKRSFGGVIARADGGGIKRYSGGELGEILDAPGSASTAPLPVAAEEESVGPGSGVVPSPFSWEDALSRIRSPDPDVATAAAAATLAHIKSGALSAGSSLEDYLEGIGSKVKGAVGDYAKRLPAFISDLPASAGAAAGVALPALHSARDAIGSWRDELKEQTDRAKNTPANLQDYAERVAATIPGLNRIRATLSPKSNYEELAKTALDRHVPGDEALSHMSPAPDPEPSPPFWRTRLIHGSSDRARGGKVKRRDGGGPANQQADNQAQTQQGGLAQIGNETPAQRASQIDPQTGKPYTRAKGGWIQGAISHPGRMKKGAERAGMSTHEYMEKHKDDSGSLGSAARLGLRLSAASKGKKAL